MNARREFDAALEHLNDQGRRTPCHRSPAWISEDPTERATAAILCRPCPLIDLCGEAADELDERWGVWAGTDRSPQARKPRKDAAA